MTVERKLNLSRRKVLGGLGTIGVASAGAGLGTTAYFSDEESFEANTLTAGELDLKVDWQQMYYGPTESLEPVNAYPDSNGDGIQDLGGIRYAGESPVFNAAEIPACCDCAEGEYYVTYAGETYCIEPLSSEDSVADFYDYNDSSGVYSSMNDDIQREDTSFIFLYEDDDGNLSLVIINDDRENEDGGSAASFRIDGAPANAGWLVSNDGEEWKVKDDREGDPSSGFDEYAIGEADWVWTNERTDGGAIGHLSENFALRIDATFNAAAENYGSRAMGDGQITDFVLLSGGSGVGAGSEEILLEDEIGVETNNDFGPLSIHSECGIESGADLPEDAFSSEHYEQDHLVQLADVKPGDWGEITFSLHLCDNPGYLWLTLPDFNQEGGVTTEPEDTPDEGELAENMMVRIWYDEDCNNEHDDSEQLIFGPGISGYTEFSGEQPATLENAVEVIERNGGRIPIDGQSPFMDFGAGETNTDRDCLPAETGMCLGLEWWIPTAVGNEIQGDIVKFDLGFYTEQCRHNDGSGVDGS